MGAYKITLKLNSLDEALARRCSTPEHAAKLAWQLLVDHGRSDVFDRRWTMTTWDSWDGAYQTDPISDHMVRGSRGTHPDSVEFTHGVVDVLTNDRNSSRSAAILARANAPYTPEPKETQNRFEMRSGKERLTVESVEGEMSVVEEFAPILEVAVKKARDAGEVGALKTLLEETLRDIGGSKTKKRPLEE